MRWARALLLMVLCALAPAAFAQSGGVRVAPVMIDMDAAKGVTSLRLRNGRDREAAFEVEVVSWTQAEGRDVLAPSDDLVVAPSVFAVAEGEEQIVRLALAPSARGEGGERAYRLLLRELPTARGESGFRVLLEMSLPVFVSPRGVSPLIEARRVIDEAGRSAVRFTNRGDGHARLGALFAPERIESAPRYLLAGASFTAPIAATRARLVYARGAGAPIEEVFELAAPAALADLR